ncbi:CDP-glycerol glycerophosphotransferase family protein [Arthrobacter sp. H35-D1]|uniref:bifunctional glycosyltransferase/CDP-glycerol:glycerophosphate glycerophosphotransferase n=1 Tax=Arthrobacter sp. H35-D1 TaxID=3046202 RepID=UPI0024B95542|nr:CDP-glycerol glycerophosphotransferase family protein [Arthrobacter sp. H35-D1]MDJ0314929.1 CDP-glycerol glycerophosphotransferase family protein [Arthrobacter sp. H35-D1]
MDNLQKISARMAKKCWRMLPANVRTLLRTGPTGVLVQRLRAGVSGKNRIANYGLLSVVVPVFNVETYLDECLSSILKQTYRRIEVIIVNDGSLDGSLKIAKKYSRMDRRVRIITKHNAGLGAARNTGISVAKGKYIAFADSDDIIPEKAYATMLATLDNTGSDFVVGSLNRLQGKKRSVPKWAKVVHSQDRLKITLSEFPEILQDVFAWNKVFVKDFWDSELISFPEGILYEDQEITTRAYVRSRSFDVLHAVVYDWRIRQDRTSITQQKHNIRDLADRLKVIGRIDDYLSGAVESQIYDSWVAKVLGSDLPLYFVQVPRVESKYWSLLQSSLSIVADHLSAATYQGIGIHERVLLRCLVADSRKDFEAVVITNDEMGRSFPIVEDDGRLYGRPSYLGLLSIDIPSELLEIAVESLAITGSLTGINCTDDGKVSVTGSAYIAGIMPDPNTRQMNVFLTKTEDGRRILLKHESRVDPTLNISANDAWTDYSASSFTTQIDLADLIQNQSDAEKGMEWRLEVVFSILGREVAGRLLNRPLTGAAASLPLLPMDELRGRWIIRHSKDGLSFVRETYKRTLNSLGIDGRVVRFTVNVPYSELDATFWLECHKLKLSTSAKVFADNGLQPIYEAILPRIPKNMQEFDEFVWRIYLINGKGKSHDLALDDSLMRQYTLRESIEALTVRSSGLGYAQLSDARRRCIAESWTMNEASNTFVVLLRFAWDDEETIPENVPRIVFSNGRSEIAPSISKWISLGSLAEYTFPLENKRWNTVAEAPESGMYTLRLAYDSALGERKVYLTPVSPLLQTRLPHDESSRNFNVRVARSSVGAALTLQFGPPLAMSERGKLMQSRIHRSLSELTDHSELRDAVLFESFGGKTVGDSGLGILNEMIRRGDSRPKYWTVADRSIAVPPGVEPLVMFSDAWFSVLHTAKYLVNNNNFPFFFRKNPGQVYIQTWHGTPLKKIGNDIENPTLSLPYVELMKREASYWDILIAQNDFAEEVLPKAFGYEGKTLNLGYPRNDSLLGEDASLRRVDIREGLGIPESQKIILYAPTWRDNQRNDNNSYAFVSFLDVKEATRKLGPEYTLLIRGHHNVAGQRFLKSELNVIDVTAYPNINDLMLASDLLVTDYSSVMFDFVGSGKPMYFLAPDLDQYRDSVRGFYFDFESVAPGPIVASTAELIDVILNESITGNYVDLYEEFRHRFAPRDDGMASARIYDAIWG